MDDETQRLRLLAQDTARRLTAKKQAWPFESRKREEPPPKRPRFTFSDGPGGAVPPPNARAPEIGSSAPVNPPGLPVNSKENWYAAAQAAEAATLAGSEGDGFDNSYTVVEVPDEFTGLIIGKHGSGIKNLQAETGASLCVGKLATEGMRKVCITGCPESQEAAKTSLWNVLERAKEHKKRKEEQGNQVVDYIELPNKFSGRLIGMKGAVLRQVREGYGVRADLDDNVNEPLRKLELKGPLQSVQMAKQHVELLLLELYRRHKIYNAPLENKYSNTSFVFEAPKQQVLGAAMKQEDLELLLQPWATHYAGNSECISIFENFQVEEMDVEIPGVEN